MQQLLNDNQNFLYYLFNLTAGGLYGLSLITSLSYQFWNILIWFGLIPAFWIYMISKKSTAWLNILSLILLVVMFVVHDWNTWFNKAVVLLEKSAILFESDYRKMSVFVCVFIPIIITLLLAYWVFSRRRFYLIMRITVIVLALVIIGFPISNWILPKVLPDYFL